MKKEESKVQNYFLLLLQSQSVIWNLTGKNSCAHSTNQLLWSKWAYQSLPIFPDTDSPLVLISRNKSISAYPRTSSHGLNLTVDIICVGHSQNVPERKTPCGAVGVKNKTHTHKVLA